MITMLSLIVHGLVIGIVCYVIYSIKRRYKTPQFAGKHVFITGASSGIGESMAYIFSALGAIVTIASNESREVTEK